MKRTHEPTAVSRRDFLKIGGAGLFVFFTVGPSAWTSIPAGAAPVSDDFNAFLRIGGDGRVSCYTGKIEMGQGVSTSLPQMLADELGVALDRVDMVMGDTDLCPYDRGTFGSLTTRAFGPALRQAAAEARAALLELASERLGVPSPSLVVDLGEIYPKGVPDRRVSFGDLTGGRRIERHVTGPVAVKDPSGFRLVNRPLKRADALEKVTGKALYAGDVRLPGMLCARILRPPAHGAKLVSVDTSGAEKLDGVRVVRDGEMVAVLHEAWDVADAALARVEARWTEPGPGPDTETIFDHLLEVAPEGALVEGRGDLAAGEREAVSVVESTYLDGYVAHAPVEPHTALARIEGGQVTVWPSSQTPFPARAEVARELGVPVEKVRVISPYVGGGFGGKSRNLQAVEAARLARLTGRPVQVAWSRLDEFFHDSFRPAGVVKIRSGTDRQGRITFWDYHVYFAGDRGAQHNYDLPHFRTLSHGGVWDVAPGVHPFAVGAWRAPSNNTNTFARESQIDAMAARAAMDPLDFRRKNLPEGKLRRVLEAAAEKFGWKSAPAPSGRGRGIACGIDAGTWVATVAEVEVDEASGEVRVKRVVCAQDMGLCVNPEGAVLQMEGCITMGLGYALSEELRFEGGRVLDTNFDTYELPRFSWLPRIETVILDDIHAAPQGGGEPAIVTMGGALANAIFDACGARVRRLPMTPARVKAALEEGRSRPERG